MCQALTKEVKEGDAEAGEFLNTLTSESYGTKIKFVVSTAQRGRAASSQDSRYYVAISQDTIPESWKDLVGEEFVGTPFSEYPDAEEQFKKAVNSGQREWGKGPLVSTTYNYTGLVIVPGEEDGDEPTLMPVRIAFLRSTKKAHDKLQTLRKALLRNRPWWELVFEFETKEQTFGRNTAYVVQVKKDRETTAEEKQAAAELALAARAGRVEANEGAAEEKREEPEAKGSIL